MSEMDVDLPPTPSPPSPLIPPGSSTLDTASPLSPSPLPSASQPSPFLTPSDSPKLTPLSASPPPPPTSSPPHSIPSSTSSPSSPLPITPKSSFHSPTTATSTPSPSTSTSPAPHRWGFAAPSTSLAPSSSPVPRRRGFTDLAKRVVMQERLKKAELEEAEAGEEDEDPEEDLSFEEMEEKAKSGDARAQTSLGRYYLGLAEEKEAELNNRLAVDWLVQAAKQGRKSAARLLQRCWIQRKGISDDNEEEVRKLSTESRFEQTVRKAAMMMFRKLNPDRKEKMAVSEMMENVGQVNAVHGGATTDQTQKVLESMVTGESGQFVDLDDFVELTKRYAQGMAPSAGSTQKQDTPKTQRLGPAQTSGEKQSGLVPKKPKKGVWGMGRSDMLMDTRRHFLVLQYPITTVIEVKDQLIDWASRAGVQWLSTVIPTHHVNALIFFFIISNLTVDLFAFFIPLLVFYLSFISMVICTLRIFQSSKAWENFSALTTLLTRFEPGLDVEQAESNFGWNNLEPYLYFLISVFFIIFSFPVADKGWIPCSELSTVAILFTVVSYKSLNPSAAAYTKRALITEVATSLCSLTSLLPQSAVLLRMLSHTFTTLPLGESVVMKISLPCLLDLYLFYLLFSMARQRGFQGTYCFLVPYLVCFLWCEFSVVLLQNSSPVGLIRTCVAYFLFLFALPVLAVGLAAMVLIQLVKWFLELELTKMIVTLAVCAVPVTLRLWTRFGLSLMDVFHSMSQRGAVKLILCCVTMVMLFFWTYLYHSEGLQGYNSTLTWKQYSALCGPPAWKEKGMAQTQIFCTHLDGHQVMWTGRFRQVRVAETENGAQSVINLLPVFMGDWLRCLYGETYPKCDPLRNNSTNTSSTTTTTTSTANSNTPVVNANLTVADADYANSPVLGVAVPTAVLHRQQEEEELCVIKALAKHTCHVKRFDSYVLEVGVGMPEEDGVPEDRDRDIKLVASHEFRQVLLRLQPGSLVEFSTTLEGRLGGQVPSFELKAIHCLDCDSSLLTAARQVKIERDWRRTTLSSVKFAFDFFFSPFLSARIDV
ncbi:wolframin [Coregonus clupeaformis]|uniref:wolframin n=1 Tax=Coregonus clupeaformis TaxID=59861 RepID=UPI001E1C8A8E|nr:wolframin [Coregonus clupeaformis]